MPSSSFEQFRQLVFKDASLMSELSELVDAEEFIGRAVELGSVRGFDFSSEDVRQALAEGRRAWIEQRV